MAAPEVSYARNGDVSIAYQVLGEWPLDLAFVPGFVFHLEVVWDCWAEFGPGAARGSSSGWRLFRV